jgi:TatD DNase family protein
VLIDIGINGTHKKIKLEWGALVRRAIEAGVERIKLTGTSFRNSLESSLMARAWYEENGTPNLFASCGVHPHNSNQFQKTHITKLRALCADPFVVSMGESGLDYNQQRMFSTREQQCLAFRTQLQLACELQMPFFLHEREAHDDFISILDEFRNCRNNNRHNNKKLPPIVIHCFTGKKEEAMAYLERGFYIGLTGFICKKNRGQHVRDFLRDIPLDRIMLETDCP